AEGADILDVGGESSRPGAEPVSVEEELSRVIPLVERITEEVDVPVSIDTTKAKVAAEALARGACIVNDISGLRMDEETAPAAAKAKAGVVLMHMLGTPRDMQKDPKYVDLMAEITSFLAEASARALAAGITKEQIVIDPGFGFGKTVEHNLEILRRLEELRVLGYPILIGTSRKSTIGKILETEVEERLEGTAATVALAIAGGADIIRVHDVKEMARVAKMADAVLRIKPPEIKEDEHVKWGESRE
nr:dihydropteroate synthase [Armatimonadota bacterium]NIM24400.1 dihydropteroate synthase [Armatimonadota bacterium]NIM68271.1 dihydropteroate synthase [Armatimonadota bacterium]NIM76675.1 dihydropteroate synthase [Armatimonadota bacterium]NIN06474.1 dihydropteroate synthase [Armatimonadota bacterium]